MSFTQIPPPSLLKDFIQYYWIIEDSSTLPVKQKIIPDGFPEIIIHYGDPYCILINKKWEVQETMLLGGQLTKFFYLQNTGRSQVLGIKLKPTALSRLYNISMGAFTDRVVSLREDASPGLDQLRSILKKHSPPFGLIEEFNQSLEKTIRSGQIPPSPIDAAVRLIFEKKGLTRIAELCLVCSFGERQLLNQFRKFIGLSPKAYARVIRLNYVLQLVQTKKENWTSLAYEAAYFDQAHFIKDFKKLTGDRPSHYLFDEKNLANFFLLNRGSYL